MQESGKILESLNLEFRYIEHEPVLDYEAATRVDKEFNLTGQESKCLFIKTKSNKFYSFITYEGVIFDRKFCMIVHSYLCRLSSLADANLNNRLGLKIRTLILR